MEDVIEAGDVSCIIYEKRIRQLTAVLRLDLVIVEIGPGLCEDFPFAWSRV